MKKKLVLFQIICSFIVFISGQEIILPKGAEWKYLDDGSDQKKEWKENNFDDSKWTSGKAQFGFGDGDEETILNKGFITYYFRKQITIENPVEIKSLIFRVVHDDAMVLYINGKEQVRSSLLPQTGEITYQTGTSTFIPTPNENDFWEYKIENLALQKGNNIIAIEIHNQNTTSSDVSFDCEVSKFSEEVVLETDGPYVLYQDGKIVVKSVEKKGIKNLTFENKNQVEIICHFSEGKDSFKVKLKTEFQEEKNYYEMPDKFLAVSDIEGNLDGFILLLKQSGIIDNNYNWKFGAGHLILVGDMFDRGKNVTELLWLIYKLENEASLQGGKVHFIIGNHDFMNLTGDLRYLNEKYKKTSKLLGEDYNRFYNKESEPGQWIRTKNFVTQIGDLLFVHAGISPQVADLNLSLEKINNIGRKRIDFQCENDTCKIVTGGSSSGVFWYRGMAKQEITQQQVDKIAELFGVKKIIIGHTIFEDITQLYNGKVIAIDLEHAKNFQKGFMKGLYYENRKLYNLKVTNSEVSKELIEYLVSVENKNEQKSNYYLGNAFPNPFNPETSIEYFLPESGKVKLVVYDVNGREVETLVDEYQAGGRYIKKFPTVKDKFSVDICSGIYFYKMITNNFTQSKKMLFIQ